MKDKRILILLALCVVIAAVVGKIITEKSEPTEINTSTETSAPVTASMHEEYPELPENNVVVVDSANDTIERFSNGSGIVFLGFKECPWCQELLPLVNEAAASENETVHYLDIKKLREDRTVGYQQLLSILSPHLPKDANGQARITVPDVSIVKDGEIVWRHEGEAVTDAEKTPEAYWTQERKDRAIQAMRRQLQALKEEGNNERL